MGSSPLAHKQLTGLPGGLRLGFSGSELIKTRGNVKPYQVSILGLGEEADSCLATGGKRGTDSSRKYGKISFRE